MNVILKQLFEEDQQDLRTMLDNRIERNRQRRDRVKGMIESGEVKAAIDFIHAAIIYQHGEEVEDFWQAYKLSVRAVELGFQPKWLAAVAADRYLLYQGKPLKYGHQVIPFGGVYRIPTIDQRTTDEERQQWDIPSLSELYAFQNLRGFVSYESIGAMRTENLHINVIKLERHPAHSPAPKGIRCETNSDEATVYENSYGWKWMEDSDGSFQLGWLLLPDVPEIAHAVADEGELVIEEVLLKEQSCILVKYNQSKTIYVKSCRGIWAITGEDYGDVMEKALILFRN